MQDLQKEFFKFHENIKLDYENKKLHDKRDTLLEKLKNNISDDAATYSIFNQGSYAMGTGVYPEDDDYDIDVGLKFNIDKKDYDNPIVPKKWVRDALKGYTKHVDIRRSCVTVTYEKNGESPYHIDFAVYASANSDGKMYIAKGKEASDRKNRNWEVSDPQGLIKLINEKYDGEDAEQFRRTIRYMKKWKTHNFDSNGDGAPTGIALTILAYDNGFYIKKKADRTTNKYVYDDFSALYTLVKNIKNRFRYRWSNTARQKCHVIKVNLPVEPYNDLFSKMNDNQMENFYQKINKMIRKLDKVKTKTERSEACAILAQIFGEEFPVPASQK